MNRSVIDVQVFCVVLSICRHLGHPQLGSISLSFTNKLLSTCMVEIYVEVPCLEERLGLTHYAYNDNEKRKRKTITIIRYR